MNIGPFLRNQFNALMKYQHFYSRLHWQLPSFIGFTCFLFTSFHFPLDLRLPQLVLRVQIPKIMELKPSRGPVSGGTIVNITGSHLDAGSNVSVMFKDQPCTYLRLVDGLWNLGESVCSPLESVQAASVAFCESLRKTPGYHLTPISAQFMSNQYILHVQLSKH